eukprot:TRINITY_DN1761_c0_g3_i1.p1 TRINITY_DN1761_c0_g3~~TRINITY_DN1761_c0_g3_i1.p1  ORF type:complete len:475 (-),score=77.95 TRINITY_DN1761_c0_g3_i1:1003-2427(-)
MNGTQWSEDEDRTSDNNRYIEMEIDGGPNFEAIDLIKTELERVAGQISALKNVVESNGSLLHSGVAQLQKLYTPLERAFEKVSTNFAAMLHYEHWLSRNGSLHDAASVGFFSALPDDVLIHIMIYLGVADLLRLASTCKTFQLLCADNVVWRRLYLLNYPCSMLVNHSMQTEWKTNYVRKTRLDASWRSGPSRITILRGHTNHVFVSHFDEENIVTSSEDNTVRIWAAQYPYPCLQTMKPHSAYVPALTMDSQFIITGSKDWTVSSFDRKSLRCLHTYTGYKAEVSCVQLQGPSIYAASRDGEVKLWDSRTGQASWELKPHSADVFCLQASDSILATGSWDRSIMLHDTRTRRLLTTFTGHTGGVYSLWFDEKRLVSSCHQTDVIIWDMKTLTPRTTITPASKGVRWLTSDGARIATGAIDYTVKVVDFEGNPITALLGHTGYVRYVQFDDSKLVSASYDSTVRVWEFGQQDAL